MKSAADLSLGPSIANTRSSARRRHRSGPESIRTESLFALPSTSPYRRNKKNGALIVPTTKEDNQTSPSSGFSKRVQDFSSIFNRALSNVTKSILRYNSKS